MSLKYNPLEKKNSNDSPKSFFFPDSNHWLPEKTELIWINQKIYFEDYSLLQNTVFQTFQYGTKIRIKINTLLYWALLFVLCCSSNETFLSVGKMGWEREYVRSGMEGCQELSETY